MNLEIRRPFVEEHGRIHDLVSQVVNETYGSIWPTTPIRVDEDDWSAGWVAIAADDLVGWMLTKDCWVEDLWVASSFWGQGIGSAFLSHAEREIGARGIATAHLSVIASNVRAIAFYERREWRRLRETPHELLSIPRVEMTKTVG
jgi:ribosomal protein S18 acetylase RimI-like enzyme